MDGCTAPAENPQKAKTEASKKATKKHGDKTEYDDNQGYAEHVVSVVAGKKDR